MNTPSNDNPQAARRLALTREAPQGRSVASGGSRYWWAYPRHNRLVWLIALCATLISPTYSEEGVIDRRFSDQNTKLWAPYVEWELPNPDYEGNPFDLLASVAFTHDDSGEQRRTQMFYAGDGVWSFRFTGTKVGRWSFTTSSDDAHLDGWQGSVTVAPNPDPNIRGFLVADGTKFAVEVADDGTLQGTLYHVYSPFERQRLFEYSLDEATLHHDIDEMLTKVDALGFNALRVSVNNSWFEFGAESYRDHDSENPDPESFRVLEALITEAHARGLHLHIWKWGDEQRRWTPIGVGGINGEPDRRLQRYIAARLGPLPGWTMSYGFDLEEWVTPDEVREWGAYLHEHLGWPHLLTARELGEHRGYVFDMGTDKLDIYSTDDRPTENFYDLAVTRLEDQEGPGLPVLFERRFLYLRDDVWDMQTTRRALWQFTMAGGAGSIWGVLWDDGRTYPNPEQLRLHREFWRDRFLLEFERANELTSGFALKSAGSHYVFYAEDSSEVSMDLTGMHDPQPAGALDTGGGMLEFHDLGVLDTAQHTWRAPYRSDWVVAVGRY